MMSAWPRLAARCMSVRASALHSSAPSAALPPLTPLLTRSGLQLLDHGEALVVWHRNARLALRLELVRGGPSVGRLVHERGVVLGLLVLVRRVEHEGQRSPRVPTKLVRWNGHGKDHQRPTGASPQAGNLVQMDNGSSTFICTHNP